MKKKENSKVNFGFFLSDASYNKMSKSSVGVVVNLETGKKKEFHFQNIKNSLEAEKKTLYKAIQFAANEKYLDPVFISDNKFAIQQVKKEFFTTDLLKRKFFYAQFLWVPREFIYIIDFFTKNLNLSLLEKEHQSYQEKIIENIQKLGAEYSLCLNFDVLQTKNLNEVKRTTVLNRENELIRLITEFLNMKNSNKSSFFKNWENKTIEEKVIFLENLSKEFPVLKVLIQDLIALISF